jgi:hypothetical protein
MDNQEINNYRRFRSKFKVWILSCLNLYYRWFRWYKWYRWIDKVIKGDGRRIFWWGGEDKEI